MRKGFFYTVLVVLLAFGVQYGYTGSVSPPGSIWYVFQAKENVDLNGNSILDGDTASLNVIDNTGDTGVVITGTNNDIKLVVGHDNNEKRFAFISRGAVGSNTNLFFEADDTIGFRRLDSTLTTVMIFDGNNDIEAIAGEFVGLPSTPTYDTSATSKSYVEANIDTGGNKEYITPTGLVMDTGTAGSDSDVQISKGTLDVTWVGGDTTHREVTWDPANTPNPDTAINIGQTGCGGLINGSSASNDTWYEIGIAADNDGTLEPCMVAFTHTSSTDNTPDTPGDLPNGYELFRSLGTPGKTLWLLTDGSSNILGFDHSSDGIITWTPTTRSAFNNLFTEVSTGGNNNRTIDISNQAPPTTINVEFNRMYSKSGSGGAIGIGLDSSSMLSARSGQIYVEDNASEESNIPVRLKKISNQIVHIRFDDTSNINTVQLTKTSSFKAVK